MDYTNFKESAFELYISSIFSLMNWGYIANGFILLGIFLIYKENSQNGKVSQRSSRQWLLFWGAAWSIGSMGQILASEIVFLIGMDTAIQDGRFPVGRNRWFNGLGGGAICSLAIAVGFVLTYFSPLKKR